MITWLVIVGYLALGFLCAKLHNKNVWKQSLKANGYYEIEREAEAHFSTFTRIYETQEERDEYIEKTKKREIEFVRSTTVSMMFIFTILAWPVVVPGYFIWHNLIKGSIDAGNPLREESKQKELEHANKVQADYIAKLELENARLAAEQDAELDKQLDWR